MTAARTGIRSRDQRRKTSSKPTESAGMAETR